MEQFEIGQAWVGLGPGDTPPLLCAIGAIDEIQGADGSQMQVLSIAITPHFEARKEGWTAISHLPVTAEAFAASGLELAPNPVTFDEHFQNGYDLWRERFDAGQAGAFSQPVGIVYLGLMTAEATRNAKAAGSA